MRAISYWALYEAVPEELMLQARPRTELGQGESSSLQASSDFAAHAAFSYQPLTRHHAQVW